MSRRPAPAARPARTARPTPTTRRSLSPRALLAPVAVAAVVGTALLVGDQGGGSPDDAAQPGGTPTTQQRIVSAEEFCEGFGALAGAQQALLEGASTETVRALKVAAGEVRDLAAGTAMPERARAGVDFVVTAFLGLEDDATAQDLVESDDAATLQDDAHAQALAAYIGDSCGAPALSEAR